jgi:hypothetical protein
MLTYAAAVLLYLQTRQSCLLQRRTFHTLEHAARGESVQVLLRLLALLAQKYKY